MPDEQEKNLGGRPTKYKAAFNKQVYKFSLLGATDEEIADFFEIEVSTLNLWKVQHPRFMESIKKGKIDADAEVSKSLFKRATGYTYLETTFEIVAGHDVVTETPEGELIKEPAYRKRVVVKEVPPDVAAQNIWLKNRRGKARTQGLPWADKHETGFTDKDGNDVTPFLSLPTDKLREIERLMQHDDTTAADNQGSPVDDPQGTI